MAAPPAALVTITAADNIGPRQVAQFDYALDILMGANDVNHPLRRAFDRWVQGRHRLLSVSRERLGADRGVLRY